MDRRMERSECKSGRKEARIKQSGRIKLGFGELRGKWAISKKIKTAKQMEKQKGEKKLVDNYPQLLEKKKPKIDSKRNGGRVFRTVLEMAGGQGNLSGKPENNTEEKVLENVALAVSNDFIMVDLVDVVDDERLGIREEQVQMVKFQRGEDRSREEKKVLTALAPMEEVIAGQCQLKLNEIKTQTQLLKRPF